MASYTIKDLENYTGIKAHTLRIWEKRYKIVMPKRTCTNIRSYNDNDLKKLLNISILNKHGFKISNIVNLSDDAVKEKILNLSQGMNNMESQIENLVVAMVELDENRFEKIFNTAVINLGFEDAIIKIMYPFFEKIGILWQIGTINPAQEHFISNLIRQKLIVAIEGLIESPDKKNTTFLLFLPEEEYHELGLLFYYYLIKKNGHKVIYLGENVPFEALEEISNVKKIDFLFTSFTSSLSAEETNTFIKKLIRQFNQQRIFITGFQTGNIDLKLPEKVKVVNDAFDFKIELSDSLFKI
ncbi:MAG: helix-turn-helix-type transcriptional regulator [Bacteroidetes bacterium 4484_249]|nr:MAG: helix-turn-helix-type transcriptional regulator [Bacteroidetes bacterium 4484_249]